MTNARRALLAGTALLLVTADAGAAVTIDALRAVENESTVQLTTTGRSSGQPRTVTVWFVRDGDHLYVQAGKDGQTDWYRNLLKTPAVTLQIDTLKLDGRARPVDDAEETARVHELFARKYLRARVMGWFGSGIGHGKVVLIDQL